MAHILETQPSKTYRGTWSEVLTHSGEIPETSEVEVRVFEPMSAKNSLSDEVGESNGRSLLEVYGHLFGTVHGGPADVAENPGKYMLGFGETASKRPIQP